MSVVALTLILATAVAPAGQNKADPTTIKSTKSGPAQIKAGGKFEVGARKFAPPLSDKAVEDTLARSEKLGNLKLNGGKVSGTALSFYPGDLLPQNLPSWTSEVYVSYSSPYLVSPWGVYINEGMGESGSRALEITVRNVHARLLVVEILLQSDERATPGTSLETHTGSGASNVQLVPPGPDGGAFFVVEPDPLTHEAMLYVVVNPTRQCVILRYTIRPVG